MARRSGPFGSFTAQVTVAPDIAYETLHAGMENTQLAFSSLAIALAKTAWSSFREFTLLLAMSFGAVALMKYGIKADDEWLKHLHESSSLVGTIGSLLGTLRHSNLGPTDLQTG